MTAADTSGLDSAMKRSARRRSLLKTVAVPTEHGGWGLTLEPALLGLLVAPGPAGVPLAFAAVVGFLARTPLKFVLVDAYRGRNLERTRIARRVAAAEILVLVGLLTASVVLAEGTFWLAGLVTAALVTVELWFDLRSRSRRLVPELAGAVGVSGIAAMIVLADGGSTATAVALWLILAARAVTSIPFVRDQVARLHGHTPKRVGLVLTDAAALLLAAAAVAVVPGALAGAATIAVVVLYQRVSALRPVKSAAVIGARQMVVGLTVVLVTALGVLAP